MTPFLSRTNHSRARRFRRRVKLKVLVISPADDWRGRILWVRIGRGQGAPRLVRGDFLLARGSSLYLLVALNGLNCRPPFTVPRIFAIVSWGVTRGPYSSCRSIGIRGARRDFDGYCYGAVDAERICGRLVATHGVVLVVVGDVLLRRVGAIAAGGGGALARWRRAVALHCGMLGMRELSI
jgi:hypothetical protein